MTTDHSAGSAYRPFAEAFFHALVEAITQTTGSPWLAAAVPGPQPPSEAEPLRLSLAFKGELQGEMLLSLASADAVLLASKCLQQAASELTQEHSNALVKLVETAAEGFCSAAQEDYGALTAAVTIASIAPSETAGVAEFTAGDDSGNRLTLLFHLQPELIASLESRARKEGSETEEQVTVVAGQPVPEQLNLALVLDVELNVTLRFGQRQLALREVLELTSGSVIELDRQVEEPVELLLEGRVIARGEAVVVDGNYGLRVTEVPQPVSVPVVR